MSSEAPHLQIGETKYGKPILDRAIMSETTLDDAPLCGLVSVGSTMCSNASVGPSVEVATYRVDFFVLEHYLRLPEDAPCLLWIRQPWNFHINEAFNALPRLVWDPFGNHLARLVFSERTDQIGFEVDVVAEMVTINAFVFSSMTRQATTRLLTVMCSHAICDSIWK